MQATPLIGTPAIREAKKPQPQLLWANEVIGYVVLLSRALVRTLEAKK